MLFEQVAGPVGGSAADGAVGVFCCGLRVVSMDGSTTDVPDSKANAEYFGRPSNATRDGAFPQVRWIVAAESGTGALIGAAIGAYTVGEQSLARDLLGAFGPGMLVLADRNFLSHTLARDVLATGAHILWRASASFKLTPVAVLADGSYLAVLHPRRKSDGPPITVRVIEYTVHTTPEGGTEESSELFCLVTDLLDIEAYPALDLACAYPMRWECETVIGHHKTDMGQGAAVLRSKDPEGVAQEMWALFAVYQAIHTLIGAAVDGPEGPVDLRAGAVVLATGGYAASPELFRELTPGRPDLVTAAECDAFDVVFTPSERHAGALARRTSTPVAVLPQATDPVVFFPEHDPAHARELVLVGNSRGVMRPILRDRAETLGLRGTIILAEEGINLFLAGDEASVRSFLGALRADRRFADIAARETWSDELPFGRMLVKLKREIIRMDHPTIRPEESRAPAVAPVDLRRWLDQGHDDSGREVVLLDTRNAMTSGAA